MDTWMAAAGVLTVGAITPGPNNLIVMREAALGGWKRALPAGLGILAGGLALLAAVLGGASALVAVGSSLFDALGVVASGLLAGFGFFALRGEPASTAPAPARPGGSLASLGGLFLFQFMNPKGWVVAVAVVSSAGDSADFSQLAALFVILPGACLALWSFAGSLWTRQLERPVVRAWFDRVVGLLLIAFAGILLLGALDVR